MQLSPPPHPSRGDAFCMQPARGSRRSAHAEPQTSVRPPKFPDARPAQAGRDRVGVRGTRRAVLDECPNTFARRSVGVRSNCGARDLRRTLRGSAGVRRPIFVITLVPVSQRGGRRARVRRSSQASYHREGIPRPPFRKGWPDHRIHQQQQECSFAPRLSNEAGVCFCGQLI